MVSPTISGTTIERRDQVLIGRRSFLAAAVCTFFARCRSTNGPFLRERGTLTSSAAQSCCAYAYCGASSCPWSASPKAIPDAGCPDPTFLRHHRAGGPLDSWPDRVRWG